jgi:hypothetical protein
MRATLRPIRRNEAPHEEKICDRSNWRHSLWLRRHMLSLAGLRRRRQNACAIPGLQGDLRPLHDCGMRPDSGKARSGHLSLHRERRLFRRLGQGVLRGPGETTSAEAQLSLLSFQVRDQVQRRSSMAFCLDSPCRVDDNNPRAAQCACNLVNTTPKPPVAPWVFVTSAYNPTSCTTGIVSSATVEDVEAVTDFLKTSKSLPRFLPIRYWSPDGK